MMINIVLGHQSEKAIVAVAVFRTLEGLVIAFFSGHYQTEMAEPGDRL